MRVPMLALKTWRDILARKGQFVALIVLVALGIASYVGFVDAYRNLTVSADTAYDDLKMPDLTVSVQSAPPGVVHKILSIPGVHAAEGRLVIDTGMDITDDNQGTVRVIGVPAGRRPAVADLLVEEGRYLASGDGAAGLLHTRFAGATGRGVGSHLSIRAGGTSVDVPIKGIVASPEYIFPVRSKGEIPAIDEFTVLYMSSHEMERIFRRQSQVNDIAVLVEPGVDPALVAERVEDVLKPYTVLQTVQRTDQPSYAALAEEIKQNRSVASVMPGLILVISALSLYIALSRLVQSQRGEIGLAKALGYGNAAILGHYLLFSVIIAVGGALLGFAAGWWLGSYTTQMYVDLLHIPYLTNGLYPDVLAVSLMLSAVACVSAGIIPAFASARIAPAKAMHSDPNLAVKGGRLPLVERAFGWALPRSFVFRLPLRNVFRQRRRSLYTVVGIAFAVLLTFATMAMYDSINWLLDDYFEATETWDISVAFEEPVNDAQVREIARWDGVTSVQPALAVPMKITSGDVQYEGAITAIEQSADFHGFSVIEGEDVPVALARGGLVMPETLTKKLGLSLGDRIVIDTPYRDDDVSLTLLSITDEALGAPMYTSMDSGAELIGSSTRRYNALYVRASERFAGQLKDDLYDLPPVAQVMVKSQIMAMFKDMMSFSYFFFGLLLGFGFLMGFVVIYTTFTANVLERTREIATMRTIGEDTGHLAVMVTLENLFLALAGIPLGLWLGAMVAKGMMDSLSSEIYNFPLVIYPKTYAFVVIASVLVLLVSEIPPIRRILRLDLAEATKVIE
ncbi:MAG: ABC transporter permease [Coriobacteriia bacterium]